MSFITINFTRSESRKDISDDITKSILDKLDLMDKRSDIWWDYSIGFSATLFGAGLIIGQVSAWRSQPQISQFSWSEFIPYAALIVVGLFLMLRSYRRRILIDR